MTRPDLEAIGRLLLREPLAAITSLDGTVREPLVCLTVPERDSLLALLRQQEEALRPFAVAEDLFLPTTGDGWPIGSGETPITLGDLRKARAALTRSDGDA